MGRNARGFGSAIADPRFCLANLHSCIAYPHSLHRRAVLSLPLPPTTLLPARRASFDRKARNENARSSGEIRVRTLKKTRSSICHRCRPSLRAIVAGHHCWLTTCARWPAAARQPDAEPPSPPDGPARPAAFLTRFALFHAVKDPCRQGLQAGRSASASADEPTCREALAHLHPVGRPHQRAPTSTIPGTTKAGRDPSCKSQPRLACRLFPMGANAPVTY